MIHESSTKGAELSESVKERAAVFDKLNECFSIYQRTVTTERHNCHEPRAAFIHLVINSSNTTETGEEY